MKLCTDCRWYRERKSVLGVNRLCAHAMLGTDPVTGNPNEIAASAQRSGMACGPMGNLWTPRVFNQVKGTVEMVNL